MNSHPDHPPACRRNYRRFLSLLSMWGLLLVTAGCTTSGKEEFYRLFPDRTWKRFSPLVFSIPVTETGTREVTFFVTLEAGFEYETLDFNMVMRTPSGEERIREYSIKVRARDGRQLLDCRGDTCRASVVLNPYLNLSKPGTLMVEIENLTPRVVTRGVVAAGIRLAPSGK